MTSAALGRVMSAQARRMLLSKHSVKAIEASGTFCVISSSRRTYCVATTFDNLNKILHQTQPAAANAQARQTRPSCVISKSASVLENAARDASSYQLCKPDICIKPSSVEQVSECVKYCYTNNIPIVPVGARSGLEGGIHAMHGGVSFDMSHMNSVLQVNDSDLDCHVEAGLSWRDLNAQIKNCGLWFPVDPGASATLGAMASTSASGTNAVKYGTMRENVIGLEVVTREGRVIKTAGGKCRAKKSSAGLNLTNLFVGSEGTLGVITSVRLRLHALPSCVGVATVAFPDVGQAVESVVQVMQFGVPVARIEFLDQPAVRACYQASKLANLDPDHPMLFVELNALSQASLEEQVALIRDVFDTHGASKFRWSSRAEERSELWKARHELHWSIMNTRPGFGNIDTDVCVPISKFPQMVAATHKLIAQYQLEAPLMGHAGDGNFHSVILFDATKARELDRAKELANEMGRVALGLEGTVTGEHGVGRGKMDLLEEQFDADTLDVMYSIKRALDPKNLFNPNKVFKCNKL